MTYQSEFSDTSVDNSKVWSVRGINVETRILLINLSRQEGKSLGRFFNENINELISVSATEPLSELRDKCVYLENEIARLRSELEVNERYVNNICSDDVGSYIINTLRVRLKKIFNSVN